MKNKKIWTILSIIIWVLQIAAEVVTAVLVMRLNVLPGKYALLLAVIFVLLAGLTGGLMFLRGKEAVSIVRRIISWVLAIGIIVGCGFVAKVAWDTYRTLHTVTTTPEETDINNMYVVVREEDPAKTIADTGDYRYGIIAEYDEERIQELIAQIQEQTGKTLSVTSYEMTAALADALLNQQVDAVIVNGAAIAVLSEEEAYEDILDKVRFLYSVPLSQLDSPEPSTEPTVPSVEEDRTVTNSPFVVYISGSDTRNKKLKISRSDVNILVIVNPVSKQILLLNTPRDYYVPNPKGKGKRDKLTHCGLYGPECSMEALGDLYGLQVDYYAQINFDGFETLVDAVGGVTINADHAFKTTNGTYIAKGENHLNGEEALQFARERYNVKGGDNGRGKNQMKVISAIIQKMTSGTTIISKYSSILKSLEGMFKTSVSMDDISLLVKMQLDDMASWNVQSYAVTGTGGRAASYSSPGHKAYVMYPDKDVVAHASELAQKVLNGETLTEEDMVPPGTK